MRARTTASATGQTMPGARNACLSAMGMIVFSAGKRWALCSWR